jgi:hypothetical protein
LNAGAPYNVPAGRAQTEQAADQSPRGVRQGNRSACTNSHRLLRAVSLSPSARERIGSSINSAQVQRHIREHSTLLGLDLANDARGRWRTTTGCTYLAAGVGQAIRGLRADLILSASSAVWKTAMMLLFGCAAKNCAGVRCET